MLIIEERNIAKNRMTNRELGITKRLNEVIHVYMYI